MKKIWILFSTVLLLFAVSLSVQAAESSVPRLLDGAGLLSDSEEKQVNDTLDRLSEQLEFDLVIVTVPDTGGKSPMAYADDYFDYNGFGWGAERSGAVLLISMKDRDWWISTRGYGITAMTDKGLDWLSSRFLPDLSDGEYADAFLAFVDGSRDLVEQARGGSPYGTRTPFGHSGGAPFPWGIVLTVALCIGLISALITVHVWKGQLKSVSARNTAGNYLRKDGLNLTESSELFLYRTVNRIRRPDPPSGGGASVHRSSSGASHGGRGGKF